MTEQFAQQQPLDWFGVQKGELSSTCHTASSWEIIEELLKQSYAHVPRRQNICNEWKLPSRNRKIALGGVPSCDDHAPRPHFDSKSILKGFLSGLKIKSTH